MRATPLAQSPTKQRTSHEKHHHLQPGRLSELFVDRHLCNCFLGHCFADLRCSAHGWWYVVRAEGKCRCPDASLRELLSELIIPRAPDHSAGATHGFGDAANSKREFHVEACAEGACLLVRIEGGIVGWIALHSPLVGYEVGQCILGANARLDGQHLRSSDESADADATKEVYRLAYLSFTFDQFVPKDCCASLT